MSFRTVGWDGDDVVLIDQRLLPLVQKDLRCPTSAAVADAIRDMAIRGAPAIGVAAAMGAALAAREAVALGRAGWRDRFDDKLAILGATRPTAVNLFWALERMRGLAGRLDQEAVADEVLVTALRNESIAICEDDVARCRAIGRHGAALVPESATVLTHCNAGGLATAGYGTALGVVRAAHAAGKVRRVLADETRPFLQGARLTAWELHHDGIPVTVITDSMAGAILARGEVDFIVVGSDRIAANGDVANKIGTYPLAVMAQRHGVPFVVAAPLSTVDLSLPDGSHIPIEERAADEVLEFAGTRVAPVGVAARHLAFDVTPAELVTAIVTEQGVHRAPYLESIREAAAAAEQERG